MRQATTWLAAAVLLGGLTGGPVPGEGWALEATERGELIFDINDSDDMREVGSRSGIRIQDDIDTRVGYFECRRWARGFGVHPYRAVVSGYLPGHPVRVWICAGEADSQPLAERYCRSLGMRYKSHLKSVVTCQVGESS